MIETERLRLRPWQNQDLPVFAEMNADPRVRRFFPSLLSREESDVSVAAFRKMCERDGFGFLAAELRETSAFIGLIGIQRMTFPLPTVPPPAVEIGWRLHPQSWGKGLATEGARAVLRFAFEELQLPEVVAFTIPANLPSRRVMEKLGMTRDPQDDFDHPRVSSGHPFRHHVLYRLQRSAWKENGESNSLPV
ncbi:MAG: GNAT family N-acetyltransferase [Acidobacteriaceae bacterium]